jgi:hypothetical protein
VDYFFDDHLEKGRVEVVGEYDTYNKAHGHYMARFNETFNHDFGMPKTKSQLILTLRVFGWIKQAKGGLGLNPSATQLTFSTSNQDIYTLLTTKNNPYQQVELKVFFNSLKKTIADYTGKKNGFKPKFNSENPFFRGNKLKTTP